MKSSLAKVILFNIIWVLSNQTHADEVYNFNFEKLPEATPHSSSSQTTVPPISKPQDGSPRSVGAAGPPDVTVVVPAPKKAQESSSHHRWTMGLGLATVNDAQGKEKENPVTDFTRDYDQNIRRDIRNRYNMLVEYRLNKYVTFDVNVAIGSQSGAWDKSGSPLKWMDLLLPSLGTNLFPINISWFGESFLSFGAQAGLARGYFGGNEYVATGAKIRNSNGEMIDEYNYARDQHQHWSLYSGLVAQLHLPADFALRYQRRLFRGRYTEDLFTLNYTF